MDPARRRPPPPRVNIDSQAPSVAPNGQHVYPVRGIGPTAASEVDVNLMEQRCKLLIRYLRQLRLHVALACISARVHLHRVGRSGERMENADYPASWSSSFICTLYANIATPCPYSTSVHAAGPLSSHTSPPRLSRSV